MNEDIDEPMFEENKDDLYLATQSQRQLAHSALITSDNVNDISLQRSIMNTPSDIDNMTFEMEQEENEDDDLESDDSDGLEKVVKASDKPFNTFQMKPFYCKCFRCENVSKTRVEYKASLQSWIISIVLCLVGCMFGCCIIPFYIKKLRNYWHYCPECGQYLASNLHNTV